MNRILILSDVAPTGDMTSGRILENVGISLSAGSQVHAFIVGDPSLQYEMRSNRFACELTWVQKPIENWSRIPALAMIGEALASKECDVITRKIQAEIFKLKPTLVVAVLQSQTLIRICDKLDYGDAKLISTLWDDWSWWQNENFLPKKVSNVLLAKRESVLQRSNLILLSSSRMCEEFKDSFGPEKCKVIYPAVEYANLRSRVSLDPNPKRKFTIGFAGQLYAKGSLRDLITAISLFNSSHDEEIELHIYSRESLIEQNDSVKEHGFLGRRELIDRLSNYDLLFLPYPFEEAFKKVVETSFPSKLADYASTEVPILFYGPGNSAVGDLFEELSHELFLDIPSPVNLLSFLNAFFSIPFFNNDYGRTNRILREEIFTLERYHKLFAADQPISQFQSLFNRDIAGPARVYRWYRPSLTQEIYSGAAKVNYWYRPSLTQAIYKRGSRLLRATGILRVRKGAKNFIIYVFRLLKGTKKFMVAETHI